MSDFYQRDQHVAFQGCFFLKPYPHLEVLRAVYVDVVRAPCEGMYIYGSRDDLVCKRMLELFREVLGIAGDLDGITAQVVCLQTSFKLSL